PNNFNTDHRNVTYGVVIRHGDLGSNVELSYYNGRWHAFVEQNHGNGNSVIVASLPRFLMKGSSAVVECPLKPIEDYLGSLVPGTSYQVNAYAWHRDTSSGPGPIDDYTRQRDLAL